MHFTFKYIQQQYEQVLALGYKVLTCKEYVTAKNQLPPLALVNRVDIDYSVKKTERLIDLFNNLNIKATFFIRLHAPEYNPLSFEHYRIIRKLIDTGHELGYHSEVMEQAAIWNEKPEDCLIRDIQVIETAFKTKIVGAASHGGMTGLNNLDFWKNRKPQEFGLWYEAYDHEPTFNLFQESFYVSDSEWTRWKCYNKGKLVADDRRSIAEHAQDLHPLMHVLIHPDTYYDRHFYE
ncbi:MAG: hypothetical protein MUE96_03765 [Bacteroidia bacterium]|jgi:peptidoglycan/xylan/chitin deacetylase (PgdA/CDA1 family)|nr:hypothetical protein [Bacteroidia bacterium]